MDRLKRTQFWGMDENDDRLIVEIIEGQKTATACPADEYDLPDGEYEDGGFEVGDIVEVYDLKKRRRCLIKITEVYSTTFGNIPEKLWKGEGNISAEEFQADHRFCWSEYKINDDFEMMINHFELLKTFPLLRIATAQDAGSIGDVYLSSRKALMPFAPLVHSDEEVRNWIKHTLIPSEKVLVAEIGKAIVGMCAFSQTETVGWIDHLYLKPERVHNGIGSALLAEALKHLTLPVRLYTFQENELARRFYEQRGFVAIAWGDGSENEEGVPDVLYELKPDSGKIHFT